MNSKKDEQELSRRDFIKAAGVTTAGLAAGSIVLNNAKVAKADNRAPVSQKVIGANDRIIFGVIGLGMMGKDHVPIVKNLAEKENVDVIAVSDIYEKRRQVVGGKAGIASDKVYSEYRRLLDNKDIDVVVIASPEHWHCQMAVEAMEAGKHIYLKSR